MGKWGKRIVLSLLVVVLLAGAGIYIADQYLTRLMVGQLDNLRAQSTEEAVTEDETTEPIDQGTSSETPANGPIIQDSDQEQVTAGAEQESLEQAAPLAPQETEESPIESPVEEEGGAEPEEGPTETAATGQGDVDPEVEEVEEPAEEPADDPPAQPAGSETETVAEEEVLEVPEAEELEKEVSLAEKAEAYKLAMSRLTSDQISRLFQIAEGGFTPEEKKEALDMFYNNFTPEERDWILSMYEKYMN